MGKPRKQGKFRQYRLNGDPHQLAAMLRCHLALCDHAGLGVLMYLPASILPPTVDALHRDGDLVLVDVCVFDCPLGPDLPISVPALSESGNWEFYEETVPVAALPDEITVSYREMVNG